MQNKPMASRAGKSTGGMNFWWKYLLLGWALLLAIPVGCDKGGNFEGRWVAPEKSKWDRTIFIRRLDITRNDKNFIIKTSTESYARSEGILQRGGKATWSASPGATASATLEEGKLIVNPFASFTFVEKEGTLLGPAGEVYRKETPNILAALKKDAAESFKKAYPTASIQ